MGYWFDFIEEKMGRRFRFAVEMTLTYTLRVLSVFACALCVVMDIACIFGIFFEGAVYGLYLIICLLFSVVSLFGAFWSFGEDW